MCMFGKGLPFFLLGSLVFFSVTEHLFPPGLFFSKPAAVSTNALTVIIMYSVALQHMESMDVFDDHTYVYRFCNILTEHINTHTHTVYLVNCLECRLFWLVCITCSWFCVRMIEGFQTKRTSSYVSLPHAEMCSFMCL